MSCSNWQGRIAADESDDPRVAEHLSGCAECREFARELGDNAAALRSIEIDAAAYVELRARVMDALHPKRRFGWTAWAAAAVSVAAACLAVVWWTAPLRIPDPGRPQAIVYRMPGPPPRVQMIAASHRKKQARRPVLQQRLTAIKLLTGDPNVVIIWLVDDKKGDSL